MAIRDIVLMGDPVLRTRAEEVTSFDDELRTLVRDMFETMYHAEGIGLAAPQVGVSKRVMVVDLRREEEPEARVALVNPVVTWASSELDKEAEGCLSIPGIEDVVVRPWAVKVTGFDPKGRPVSLEAEELFSRAIQHEIDHVDGILFLDRLSPLKRRMQMRKWKKLREDEAS
ncbi:MAG TPA: peptide deformylase [Longimicrobiales bacterium]|nr:peptide deformylase [Longimicrobiales bacterium]